MTAETIAAGDARRVGLLATTGTVRSGLYADALGERGVSVVTPETGDQQLVMNAIAAVKAGRSRSADGRALAAVARRLAGRGAEQVVAACIELVLALGESNRGFTIVDPARLLARRIVEIVCQEVG